MMRDDFLYSSFAALGVSNSSFSRNVLQVICLQRHGASSTSRTYGLDSRTSWDFEPELDELSVSVQDAILAHTQLLRTFGPSLGRPRVDTLKGSKHSNMKELRFQAVDGAWRVAFAFDPRRNAILLVAGDKSGGSEKRFYKQLIKKADQRFNQHLQQFKKGSKQWARL